MANIGFGPKLLGSAEPASEALAPPLDARVSLHHKLTGFAFKKKLSNKFANDGLQPFGQRRKQLSRLTVFPNPGPKNGLYIANPCNGRKSSFQKYFISSILESKEEDDKYNILIKI